MTAALQFICRDLYLAFPSPSFAFLRTGAQFRSNTVGVQIQGKGEGDDGVQYSNIINPKCYVARVCP